MTELRNFLSLAYDELEELNLKAKEQRTKRVAAHKIKSSRKQEREFQLPMKETVLIGDLAEVSLGYLTEFSFAIEKASRESRRLLRTAPTDRFSIAL